MSRRKQVLVFGGSLSPPTLAHEAIIRHSLSLPEYDEVWLVPSWNRTDKNIAVSPEHQLAMLDVLIASSFERHPKLRVLDTELRRGIATETYDTYQEFLREHPEKDFRFLFGADSYTSIRSWLGGDFLAENLPVIIVPRGNHPMPDLAPHIAHFPPLAEAVSGVSSTAVRDAVATSRPVAALVPQPIADYVVHTELFR